ncbi:hypothetical protein ACWD5Q_27125 [Streptomyces sp. NPDC002513]
MAFLAFFLFLILAAVALGLIGAVIKGFFYLLIIGVVVFVASLALSGFRWSRRWHRHTVR